MKASAYLSFINIFCRDIEKQCAFYADLFELEEILSARSPVFRGLRAGASDLGFSAPGAYELLNLDDSEPTGIRSFLTFEAPTRDAVDQLTELAVSNGAKIAKPATSTYYGWYQSVLLDPEGNVFRINFKS